MGVDVDGHVFSALKAEAGVSLYLLFCVRRSLMQFRNRSSPLPCPQSAQNRLLIKGGRVANEDRIFDADIYIEDGIIR